MQGHLTIISGAHHARLGVRTRRHDLDKGLISIKFSVMRLQLDRALQRPDIGRHKQAAIHGQEMGNKGQFHMRARTDTVQRLRHLRQVPVTRGIIGPKRLGDLRKLGGRRGLSASPADA